MRQAQQAIERARLAVQSAGGCHSCHSHKQEVRNLTLTEQINSGQINNDQMTTNLGEYENAFSSGAILDEFLGVPLRANRHDEGRHSPLDLIATNPPFKPSRSSRQKNHASAASLPVLEPLTARDGLTLPAPRVNPPRRVRCPDLGDVVRLGELKDGPRRLLALLHSLGVHVVATKGYAVCPSQVTFHQSQELLALKLGVSTKSIQRWTGQLQELGHVAARAHYGGSKHAARIDGLVIAVSLKAGHLARLHHDDLAHQWRNLNADRQAGRTAWAAREIVLSESGKARQEKTFQILKGWAVTGSLYQPPFFTDSDRGSGGVLDVVYTLPLLGDVPTRDRAAIVGRLAVTLAQGLKDHHSAAWYASLIWRALGAERDGLTALQPLAALLARLWTDCEEWPALRRPGALLAARLRPMQ